MPGLTAPPDNFDPAGETIAADGWFPAIETADIRATIRLGEGAVTDARLRAAVEGAILSGLRALAEWRAARVLAGAADLSATTELLLDGQNMAVAIWQRVVRYYAAAELADLHIDVSATDEALDREEEKRESADMYRRKAYEAVADLRSIGALTEDEIAASQRNRVALI